MPPKQPFALKPITKVGLMFWGRWSTIQRHPDIAYKLSRKLALSPKIHFLLISAALVLATSVGVLLWPSDLGAVSTVVALLLLLPLTFVSALDVVRYLKSNSPTPEASFFRIALTIPLGALALFALIIGLAFPIFLGAKWSSESPRALIGGIIAGAVFLGFGIKLLHVLWSHKNDKHIS